MQEFYKIMADVSHQRFTKLRFNAPPLTEINVRLFFLSNCMMLWIQIYSKNAFEGENEIQICPTNCKTDNVMNSFLHARSSSMFCDITLRDRLMPKAVKASNTASAYILPKKPFNDV